MAFVVDGWALEILLKHYRKAFTELAILSRTAICCRVTPSQKAQVAWIKFVMLVFHLHFPNLHCQLKFILRKIDCQILFFAWLVVLCICKLWPSFEYKEKMKSRSNTWHSKEFLFRMER